MLRGQSWPQGLEEQRVLGTVRGAQRVLFGCARWGLGGTSPSGCPPGPLFAISSWRSKIWWALGEPGWDVRAGLQPPRAIVAFIPCAREKGTSAPRTGRRRGQRTLTLSCRVLVEGKAPRTDRTDRTGQDGQDSLRDAQQISAPHSILPAAPRG